MHKITKVGWIRGASAIVIICLWKIVDRSPWKLIKSSTVQSNNKMFIGSIKNRIFQELESILLQGEDVLQMGY